MEPKEYVDSLRLHLGCAGPGEPVPCAACQSGSLDTGAAHATCCALSEATGGHNAVTALVHAGAQSCDCTAENEAPGLIPGTDLTSALVNTNAALEISICSPHAQQAGFRLHTDQIRGQTRLLRRAPPFHLRQNISHTPIVWSASGRPHRDTLTVLRSLSKSTARKRNFVSAEVVYPKLHASITLEIWKRSARQIRACWPFRTFWTLTLGLCLGPLRLPFPAAFWSLSHRCLCFPWPVLFLRRAPVFAPSRFVCPSHVTCAAHGSVRAAPTGCAAGLAGIS